MMSWMLNFESNYNDIAGITGSTFCGIRSGYFNKTTPAVMNITNTLIGIYGQIYSQLATY